jgi:hypothetical protein
MDPRKFSEAVLQDLLAADAVLPEQFWNSENGTTHLSGERALMWAVFADGIQTYRRNARATSAQNQVQFLEAEHWLLSTDWDWPFSFVNLCEAFGFNPAGIRRALLTWKRGQRQAIRRQRFRPVILAA